MAAKRQRDYKAEEARRNELARAAGFTSRGQMRRAIEMSKDYSQRMSIPGSVSAFEPDKRKEGMTKEQYIKAYFDMFVNRTTGVKALKGRQTHNAAMKRYLVDAIGYYTSEEYDEKYGEAQG